MATTRSATRTKAAVGADEVQLKSSVLIFTFAGVPVDGTSGTKAGKAGIGSLCINRTSGLLYQNTGTKASPTWTAR